MGWDMRARPGSISTYIDEYGALRIKGSFIFAIKHFDFGQNRIPDQDVSINIMFEEFLFTFKGKEQLVATFFYRRLYVVLTSPCFHNQPENIIFELRNSAFLRLARRIALPNSPHCCFTICSYNYLW